MMNLIPHHRLHIPNTLAVFAVILLLVASAVSFSGTQDIYPSGKYITSSATVTAADSSDMNNSVENKRRGLKLGLLLFRR